MANNPAPDPSGQWVETDIGGGEYYDPVTFRIGHKQADGSITPDPPGQDGTYYLWNPNAFPKAKRHGSAIAVNADGTLKDPDYPDPRTQEQRDTQTSAGAQSATTLQGESNYAVGQRNVADQRAAAEAASADAIRQRQIALADALNKTITDPSTPSVAQTQLDQATQANEATQLSAASGATGENAFLARQGAARNIAAINQNEAQQKSQLRATEVSDAQKNLGAILGQTGNQDITRYGTDTGAAGGYTNALLNTNLKSTDQANSQKNADRDFWMNLGTKAAVALGSSLSDRRAKEDIHEEPPDRVMAFLSAITPDSFKYKGEDPAAPDHHGVMAQDLEKSEIGRSLVHDTPRGKMVDVGSAAMAALAAVAHLHRRVESVEGRKGGGRA